MRATAKQPPVVKYKTDAHPAVAVFLRAVFYERTEQKTVPNR